MPELAAIAAVVTAASAVYGAVSASEAQSKAAQAQKDDAKKAIETEAALARSNADKKGAKIEFGTGTSDEILKRGFKAKSSGRTNVGGTNTTSVGGL